MTRTKNASRRARREKLLYLPSGWIVALSVTGRTSALPDRQQTTDEVGVIRRVLALKLVRRGDQGRVGVIVREELG